MTIDKITTPTASLLVNFGAGIATREEVRFAFHRKMCLLSIEVVPEGTNPI
jgi:hypothetical protein